MPRVSLSCLCFMPRELKQPLLKPYLSAPCPGEMCIHPHLLTQPPPQPWDPGSDPHSYLSPSQTPLAAWAASRAEQEAQAGSSSISARDTVGTKHQPAESRPQACDTPGHPAAHPSRAGKGPPSPALAAPGLVLSPRTNRPTRGEKLLLPNRLCSFFCPTLHNGAAGTLPLVLQERCRNAARAQQDSARLPGRSQLGRSAMPRLLLPVRGCATHLRSSAGRARPGCR